MEDRRATHGDSKIADKADQAKEGLKGAARRVEGAITGDEGKRSEHDKSSIEKACSGNKSSGEKAWDKAGDKAEKGKEDLKGAARRVEGELKDDEGLKSEHDKSTLEKAGEAIYDAGVAAKDKVVETAENWGIINKQ